MIFCCGFSVIICHNLSNAIRLAAGTPPSVHRLTLTSSLHALHCLPGKQFSSISPSVTAITSPLCLCLFRTDLPTRSGSATKGDIRSFLRSCDAVNRGNYCVQEVNFQRETCYSTCRKDNCNEGDGSPIERDNSTTSDALDWPELFNFNADLNGSSTTRVAHALVAMAAIFVFLNK